MTQTERIIRAARSYRGVCQVDLLGPHTIDGGSPITRLAARIQDAEARGYVFEIIGTRHKTRVYRLISSPDVERAGSASAARREGPASSAKPRTGSLNAEPATQTSKTDAPPQRSWGEDPVRSTADDSPSAAQGALFKAPAERPGHYRDAA